jgi:hypothetical protein
VYGLRQDNGRTKRDIINPPQVLKKITEISMVWLIRCQAVQSRFPSTGSYVEDCGAPRLFEALRLPNVSMTVRDSL